jgi:hypothetical protein
LTIFMVVKKIGAWPAKDLRNGTDFAKPEFSESARKRALLWGRVFFSAPPAVWMAVRRWFALSGPMGV